MKTRLPLIITLLLMLAACNSNTGPAAPQADEEDTQAKQLLQGIWVNEDDENPLFYMQGDSVYFPDNAGEPQHFAVITDTLIIYGTNHTKYPIERLADHLFIFRNQTGETIRLVKIDDGSYDSFFMTSSSRTTETTAELNQRRTLRTDTVVMAGDERYHCYLQVNPTTYKVYKSVYNDEGVEMENIYYDNTIYLAIFSGAQKLYSHEFTKADFAGHISEDILRQTILNDISIDKVAPTQISYRAQLALPDTPTSYILQVVVTLSPTPAMTIVIDE